MTSAGGSLVVFTPSGKRGRFDEDSSPLDAARSLGVDLDSVCGGRGICGRCQVVVAEGEFAKHGITSRADHPRPSASPRSGTGSGAGSLRIGGWAAMPASPATS
jgi:uncharacterized 2Fe-2S/4Fe-4S cluster protein (DUF4445 family)